MEDTITQQFDQKDIECVDILEKTGYSRCAAKVIVALVTGDKTQRELTICTDENQSAISVALKKLKNDEAVTISEIKSATGKGRPKHIYNLVSWDAMVGVAEHKVAAEIAEKNADIDKLKELVN